jgi:hypothetical protein
VGFVAAPVAAVLLLGVDGLEASVHDLGRREGGVAVPVRRVGLGVAVLLGRVLVLGFLVPVLGFLVAVLGLGRGVLGLFIAILWGIIPV